MLIKVLTNYGHAANGRVTLKTPKMPPFSIDGKKGAELIARGIAVKVADEEESAEESAPAESADFDSMTRADLLEMAKERGLDVDARSKKQEIITALRESAE